MAALAGPKPLQTTWRRASLAGAVAAVYSVCGLNSAIQSESRRRPNRELLLQQACVSHHWPNEKVGQQMIDDQQMN